MPRRAPIQPVLLEDFFVDDVDYAESDDEEEEEQEGDDNQGGSEEEEEGTGVSEGSESEEDDDEEEEEEEGQLVHGVDCEPSAGARVSGVAAPAAERGSMPTCPVCMEAWTSEGAHRISCIPCGHVYGRSCLERWLTQRGNGNQNQSATCPQCGRRYKQKDIINLYAPDIAILNNELEKEVSNLREKKVFLEKTIMQHGSLLADLTKRMIDIEERIEDASSKRQKIMEPWDEATHLEPPKSITVDFSLQNELSLDGARVMSIDASNHIVLASGRAASVGGEQVLTKISMLSINDACKIHLPPDTKAVRDMCILPGGSAIFTSLGKRLSLFSMANDSIVLQCDLPAPGWSCSADISNSQHIYAGLQNGMLLTFDIRHSARPLRSMVGLSAHPIHTLHSVIDSDGSKKVLSASAIGPCMWDADGESRPNLLTGSENKRVCISLACAPLSSDLLVASFRPKVETSSEEITGSQVYLSQTPTKYGSDKLGHHTLIRKTGKASFAEGATCYASVSAIRMSKSAIIPYGNNQHLFACGDESLRGVRTWELPSFAVYADLSPHRQPILDLRYAESPGGGRYLGCLSEEKLQVFRIR